MIKLLLEYEARITFNHRDWFESHASQQIKDIIAPPMPSVDQYSKLFQDDVIVTDVVPTTVETESTSKVVAWFQANKKAILAAGSSLALGLLIWKYKSKQNKSPKPNTSK